MVITMAKLRMAHASRLGQFLQNTTQANTVKNDQIEGDGFARVMNNIKYKAYLSSPQKALSWKG